MEKTCEASGWEIVPGSFDVVRERRLGISVPQEQDTSGDVNEDRGFWKKTEDEDRGFWKKSEEEDEDRGFWKKSEEEDADRGFWKKSARRGSASASYTGSAAYTERDSVVILIRMKRSWKWWEADDSLKIVVKMIPVPHREGCTPRKPEFQDWTFRQERVAWSRMG